MLWLFMEKFTLLLSTQEDAVFEVSGFLCLINGLSLVLVEYTVTFVVRFLLLDDILFSS